MSGSPSRSITVKSTSREESSNAVWRAGQSCMVVAVQCSGAPLPHLHCRESVPLPVGPGQPPGEDQQAARVAPTAVQPAHTLASQSHITTPRATQGHTDKSSHPVLY